VLYSILLEEWPEVKRRMEARLMRDSTASERTA
jgi:hypothetical protein